MSMPAFHYPLVAFVLLSCLLNLAIIFGILRFRRTNPYLKGSYFALVIFHGAADILLSCEFTLLMRARKYRYLDFVLTENSTLWHVLPWITNGLHYYLKAVLYMGHILLSFNRFTSAFYPLHYEMFWKSKIMIFARFFAWAIPLFFVSPIVLNFNYEMWFSMGENNETVRLQSDDVSTQLLSYVDASLTLSATTICLIFYALSAVKISRQMLKHGIQQKHSVEIRLFLSSFFLFILLSVNTIIQVWTIVASKQGHNDMVMKLNDVSYPVLDAMYSANPWVLFITSSAIRDAVIRLLLPFRYYKASQIMVVSSFTSVTSSNLTTRQY
ncbi:hypothetical protein QR680_016457 [Steinernema hermaphroditum]|uniref:Serpentine receptor class gamma n=1 Tax=Steinernema hermaphroditum TaxID=289476 RepID=A0AA39HB98_9BILA|nr:hypothetical protein QR680_016457 [Steinernema hermaphroditum]